MPFQTMFLCAGLGTRLRPLTLELPKPLVPIGDRPLLLHLLDTLEQAGGALRVVNTHHRPKEIQEFVREHCPNTLISHEPEILGTAGAIAQVRPLLNDAPLLVWNADILSSPNLSELVKQAQSVPMAMAVALRNRGEGTCGLDAENRVVRVRGRVFGEESQGADYMGVVALGEQAIRQLPARGCLVGDYLLPLLERGGVALGVPQHCGFSDVGTLSSYLRENLRWLAARTPAGSAYIHPSVTRPLGVDVRNSVVGAGANIQGHGVIERVVVWPGATVVAPLCDAVVTPASGVVRVNLNEA